MQVFVAILTSAYTLVITLGKIGSYDQKLMIALIAVLPLNLVIAFVMGKMKFLKLLFFFSVRFDEKKIIGFFCNRLCQLCIFLIYQIRNIRKMIWSKTVRLPLRYYEKNKPKEMISRITTDITAISQLIKLPMLPLSFPKTRSILFPCLFLISEHLLLYFHSYIEAAIRFPAFRTLWPRPGGLF